MTQHYAPRERCKRCGYIGEHDQATCDRLLEALRTLAERANLPWQPIPERR